MDLSTGRWSWCRRAACFVYVLLLLYFRLMVGPEVDRPTLDGQRVYSMQLIFSIFDWWSVVKLVVLSFPKFFLSFEKPSYTTRSILRPSVHQSNPMIGFKSICLFNTCERTHKKTNRNTQVILGMTHSLKNMWNIKQVIINKTHNFNVICLGISRWCVLGECVF